MQNGKGDKPRPIKNISQFVENWDEINWSVKKSSKTSKHIKTPPKK